MIDEIWKPIPGFDDYAVSNTGKVASMARGWRVLKPGRTSAGYLQVGMYVNKVQRMSLVHRLVAEAFLGPRPTPGHQVNHRNGIKTDPRSENLEWCTRSENSHHAYDVLGNKSVRGEANGRSTLTEADVPNIRARYAAGELQKDIAADYGVHQVTISQVVLRKHWAWL